MPGKRRETEKSTFEELLFRLGELEECSRLRSADGNLQKAEALTMFIARNAPDGRIANLAMRAMSAVIQARNAGQGADGEFPAAVSRLAAALRGTQES